MYTKIKDLPITSHLDQICTELKNSPTRFLILTAETGAGKSTAIPLALLKNFSGKILMLEPRRLAAIAISGRVADLLNEQTGKTSGYRLFLENKISDSTRFEVCTEAILTKMIQQDPALEGINVIVLDEFHERSIHSDFALALLKEVMELRDDLYVIIMSATMDIKSLQNYLSTNDSSPNDRSEAKLTPVISIKGRSYPVQISYEDALPVHETILNEINTNYRSVTNERSDFRNDTILVFLPGLSEILKTKQLLQENLSPDKAEILILHSSINLAEQKKILCPPDSDSPQRIILSSAIAETSLTVPGVYCVIDSGLCRFNRLNLNTGMDQLITQKISQFNADQRTGRAGRTMAGKCIRCWNKFDPIPLSIDPEISRIDLSALVLECYKWGTPSRNELKWLTPPSESSWNSAEIFLNNSGCIKDGKITSLGNAILQLPLNIRLASLVIKGYETENLQTAIDLALKYSPYSQSSSSIQAQFKNSITSRLNKIALSHQKEKISATRLLLSAFPDRLCKKCLIQNSAEKTEYQFPSGRIALCPVRNSTAPQWIVAPEVTISNNSGFIKTYQEVTEEDAQAFLEPHIQLIEKSEFESFDKNKINSLKLKKNLYTCYGKIILKEAKLIPQATDFADALCNHIHNEGIEILPLDQKITDFLLRAEFYSSQQSPELYEKICTLSKTSHLWLKPFITQAGINSNMIYDSLYWYLNGSQIDSQVPVQIVLKNGKKLKISYEKHINSQQQTNVRSLNISESIIVPSAEVIIQQMFGCFETPKIMGIPVKLKLLSPARRPLQITEDLENFWTGAWIEICKEMKGRYPKHNWDYRISEKD